MGRHIHERVLRSEKGCRIRVTHFHACSDCVHTRDATIRLDYAYLFVRAIYSSHIVSIKLGTVTEKAVAACIFFGERGGGLLLFAFCFFWLLLAPFFGGRGEEGEEGCCCLALLFGLLFRNTSFCATISHDNNHRTSKHASMSWRSDGSPLCLGGSSHGWVPVKSHSTPVPTSMVRLWVAHQLHDTTTSRRKRTQHNDNMAAEQVLCDLSVPQSKCCAILRCAEQCVHGVCRRS